MIPKFIFDKSQTTLVDIPIKDRLLVFRKLLYNDYYSKMINLNNDRILLTKNYLLEIKEIDEELKSIKKQNGC